MAKKLIDCKRCDGKGHIRAYGHVQGGVCFKCKGEGKIWVTIKSAAQIAREEARKAEKEAYHRACAKASTDAIAKIRAYYISQDDPRFSTLETIPEQYHGTHFLEWAGKDFGTRGYNAVKIWDQIKERI